MLSLLVYNISIRRQSIALEWVLITGYIKNKLQRIWFSGDTGFSPVFEKKVSKRLPPVDLAIIPIGAFLPCDITKPVHVTPEEGLKLANVMGAKIAIPMHWRIFSLGEDSPKTGMRRFLQAPVSGINKLIMKIGETIDLTKFNWLTGQIGID